MHLVLIKITSTANRKMVDVFIFDRRHYHQTEFKNDFLTTKRSPEQEFNF